MDVQHEPLYDTYVAAAATTIPNNTQFFTNPSGKTINQTNVTTPKKLDAPEAFAVMGIRFHPLESILLADFVALMNSFVLEFWIGQKYYNRGPLWHYNAGGGISGFTTASAASAYTNGLTGRIHMNELAINIVIDNQASFYGNLNGVPVVLTAAGYRWHRCHARHAARRAPRARRPVNHWAVSVTLYPAQSHRLSSGGGVAPGAGPLSSSEWRPGKLNSEKPKETTTPCLTPSRLPPCKGSTSPWDRI